MRQWRCLHDVTRRLHQNLLPNDRATSLPECMSAWQCMDYAQPHKLSEHLNCTRTRRLPLITRPDHLLVKVHAASLNPVDLLCLSGYGASTFSHARHFGSCFGVLGLPATNGSEFPVTPGRDFAGRVVDSAPTRLNHPSMKKTQFALHDRVAGATWPFLSSTGSGAMANYVVCPEAYIARIPENVSATEATAIGYAGLTGWSALSAADLHPSIAKTGSHLPLVLVAGATGGVGLAAAQLAKIWGCRVHVTCPEDARAQSMLQELEFEDIIIYPDNPPAGVKYDVIIDCVRPSSLSKALASSDEGFQATAQILIPSLPQLFDYLSPHSNARYVTLNSPLLFLADYFGLAMGTGLAVSQRVASQLLAISAFGGNKCGQLRWGFFKPSGRRLQAMLDLLSRGMFKVYIEEVYPFEQVPAAFTRLRKGGVRGKLVVRVADE